VSGGRTSWWPKDAAWHRRELIVELGTEHGPAGPCVMDVLSSWAQEQRAGGAVRGGFLILAREAFVSREAAQAVVEHAGRIGALDDVEVDDDGRRFACRVSGWQADQDSGRAAFRKAAERARRGRDMSQPDPPDRDESRSVTPSSLPDQTREEGTTSVEPRLDEPDPEVARLCHLLAELIAINDPKAASRVKPASRRWLTAMRLLIADRGGDVVEVERILRWSQTDPFWQTNILSPTKLREQFTQLLLRSRGQHLRAVSTPERDERRARGGKALAAMLAGQGDDAA
jgi:hypothetical protein